MTPRTEDGLATITFFQHEMEMWKQKKKEQKLAAALTVVSILLIIAIKKR